MSVRGGPDMRWDRQYVDLALRIESRGDGRCDVRVVSAPFGGEARSETSWTCSEMLDLIATMETVVRGSGGRGVATTASPDRDLRSGGVRGHLSPEAAGTRLFRLLFSGGVLAAFQRTLGHVESHPGTGLRLRLEFALDKDPPSADLIEISSLPWELLYSPDLGGFLAVDRETPLIRYLDVPRVIRHPQLLSSLRILVVPAQMPGGAQLDLDGERQGLIAAWQGDGRVEVEVLANASLAELRRRLEATPYNVLHFMGHGDFAEHTGTGRLLFEPAVSTPEPVSGRRLSEVLRDCRSLQLVVLNACDTARLPRRRGQDPFSGVASALLLAGLPAVVAMQFPISDEAALAFTGGFYRALAAGMPIGSATAEGRRAIRLTSDTSLEWATPALFMSVPDASILAAPGSPSPEDEPDRRPQVLGLLWQALLGALLAALLVATSLCPARKDLQLGVEETHRDIYSQAATSRRVQKTCGYVADTKCDEASRGTFLNFAAPSLIKRGAP
jgi:hypothetical protein